jgi:hypothetical protein
MAVEFAGIFLLRFDGLILLVIRSTREMMF